MLGKWRINYYKVNGVKIYHDRRPREFGYYARLVGLVGLGYFFAHVLVGVR